MKSKSRTSRPRSDDLGKPSRMMLVLAGLGISGAFGPAFAAQDTKKADEDPKPALQVVIVTAQKTRENIQNVPITMSALTTKSMKMGEMVGFHEWGDSIPGLQMEQGTAPNRRAGPTAVIRGVSQSNAGQLYEVSAMATTNYTFGEVPINAGDPALFDMNRIEVLKGPQGALFGLASMGGTIRYIPNYADTHRFSAEFTGGAGMIAHGGTQHNLEVMLNAPIIDNVLAVRFAAETVHSDGYITVHTLPLTDNTFSSIQINDSPALGPANLGDIPNANSNTLSAERILLTYTPTKDLSIRTYAMQQTQDQADKQNIDYNASIGGWNAWRYTREPQTNKFRVFGVESQYDMRFGSLNYIFGSQYRGQTETLDFTPITPYLLSSGSTFALQMNPNLPEDPLPSATVFPFFSENRTVSNELRLQGNDEPLAGPLTFNYVLGLFRMTEKADGDWAIKNPTWNTDKGPNTEPILTTGGLILGQTGGGDFSTSAAFGDLTINIAHKLQIGGGVRFSRDRRTNELHTYGDAETGTAASGATVGSDIYGPGVVTSGIAHDSSVTPRAFVSYRFDEDRMVYLNAAKGERAPESFPNPKYFEKSTPECIQLAQNLGLYEPALEGTKSDVVWSYDLGLKSAWLDHRLILNPAIYDVRWSGYQLNVLLNNFSAACQQIIDANVGDVEIKGVELSAKYAPIDSLVLTGAFTYSHAGLAKDVQGVTSTLGTPLKKGDTITEAPPWQINATAEYTFPVPFSGAQGFVYGDWRYVGERFQQVIGNRNELRIQQPFNVAHSYSLADLRLGVQTERWSGSVYCTNVFDKRAMYASQKVVWFPNQRVVSVSQPRTIGFDFSLYF
jgi:outer membrane receptor protein involved in Fe transport